MQDAVTEGLLVRWKPFIWHLQLQVKKQSCLFERWCWTIFSQWDLGTSLKVAQKAAEIPSRRQGPYMAHAESPLLSVSAAPSLSVLLSLVSLSTRALLPQPLPLPLYCDPAPMMFSRGSPEVLRVSLWTVFGLHTHTHTRQRREHSRLRTSAAWFIGEHRLVSLYRKFHWERSWTPDWCSRRTEAGCFY